jgi:hypothetical protein
MPSPMPSTSAAACPPSTFFQDFAAKLADVRVMLVEYKGEHSGDKGSALENSDSEGDGDKSGSMRPVANGG